MLIRICIDTPIEDDEFNWNEIDYNLFIRMVIHHNMYGRLLYHAQNKHNTANSLKFWLRIKATAIMLGNTNENSNVNQDDFISRILKIMKDNGYNGIVMKGPVLQTVIYVNRPYMRNFGDLDVLLPQIQAIDFHSYLLKNEGLKYGGRYSTNNTSWYKAGMEMSQHLIPLYDKDGTIEIHHRLNQSFMTIKPDLSVIFRNAKTISSKWGGDDYT